MALRQMDAPQIDLRQTIIEKEKEETGFKQIKDPKKQVERLRKLQEKVYKFPKSFLWGTSTSAYQVEGGIHNDWSEWEKSDKRRERLAVQNKSLGQYVCGAGVDSYKRYKEDVDLAAALNTNAMRVGLEWSRINPKKDTWDVEAVNHYRDQLQYMQERGMTTAVTLWHWTNPIWVSREDGWEKKETVDHFLKYVEFMVKELGGYIDYWVTLNEPMIHPTNGYLVGKFPPGKKNPIRAEKVFRNLVRAHIGAYDTIHKYFPRARVGFTKLRNYYEPAHSWNPVEKYLARFLDYYGNKRFFNLTEKHMDYVGIDYYFHDRVVWYPPFVRNKNIEVTDLGWEIYPEGLYHVLKSVARFNKPVIIMENGLADKDDKQRETFIKEHLYYVHKAITEGVDVRGYFHWSLLDNFEWDKGWEPKFGLYSVDRNNFKRTPRSSAKVYAEICKSNSVSVAM